MIRSGILTKQDRCAWRGMLERLKMSTDKSPHPELLNALEWYRCLLDRYDPDHHITFHYIKSDGKEKNRYGYVRVALKPAGIHKEFILTSHSRSALESAVARARRFRDTIPADIIMTQKVPNQDLWVPRYPGVRYRNDTYKHCWIAFLGENHRPRHKEFQVGAHGYTGALRKAIEIRKDHDFRALTQKKPRLITEKYAHLFDF